MYKINLLTAGKMFTDIGNVKKINPKKLGYICPDGTINFADSNVALEYAKNRVVTPLRQNEPFERLVLIDKSRIVKEVDGTKDGVNFDTKKYNFDTIVHGHPDVLGKGKTLPISIEDIVLLFKNAENGAKRSIVYNSRGEYSMLERKNPSVKLENVPPPIRQHYFKDFNNKCLLAVYDFMDELERLTTKKIMELKLNGKLKDFIKNIPEGELLKELNIKINSLILHKSIKDNCDKFGAIYRTNFSNLVN